MQKVWAKNFSYLHFLMFGEDTAIVYNEKTYSYRQLTVDIEEIIFLINKDFMSAKIIYWQGTDFYYLVCLLFAAMATNKLLIPGITAAAHQRFTENVSMDTIVSDRKWQSITKKNNISDIDPDIVNESGLILPTSGSTSLVKLALLSKEMLFENAKIATLAQSLKRGDQILALSGLAHTGGWNINLLPGLIAGCQIDLVGLFSAHGFFAKIKNRTGLKLHLSPPQINLLMKTKNWKSFKNDSIELIVTGSSEVWPHIITQLIDKGVEKVVRNYGLTEAGPFVFYECTTANNILDSDLNSLGKIAPNFKFQLSGQGELLLSGSALSIGYFVKKQFLKNKEVFFSTGDVLLKSPKNFSYAGRLSDKIEINSKTIFPSVFEREIFNDFSKIYECCLKKSNSNKLILYLCGDDSQDNHIKTFLKNKHPKFQVDVIWQLRLPRNNNGKILRSQLPMDSL